MKRILLLSLLVIFTNVSYARNYGHICITYLSKNGTLAISDQNKFTLDEYNKLLAHINKNKTNEKKYKFLEKSVYVRGIKQGVTEKYDVYGPTKSEGPFYQNGIIYFETAGDWETSEMTRFKSIIGGEFNFECIEMPSIRDMREAEELRDFLESNKDLLESNE